MSKISLTDATAQQLRHFAGVVLGLDVHPNSNAPQLVAKINAADPTITEIDVEGMPEDAAKITNRPPPAAGNEADKSYHGDPKVRLMIRSSKEPGGEHDVQVAVNGDSFLIKRDLEMDVPYRVYNALRDARETDVSQSKATPGAPAQMMTREVLSYPFEVLDLPSKADITAYEARTANHFAP